MVLCHCCQDATFHKVLQFDPSVGSHGAFIVKEVPEITSAAAGASGAAGASRLIIDTSKGGRQPGSFGGEQHLWTAPPVPTLGLVGPTVRTASSTSGTAAASAPTSGTLTCQPSGVAGLCEASPWDSPTNHQLLNLAAAFDSLAVRSPASAAARSSNSAAAQIPSPAGAHMSSAAAYSTLPFGTGSIAGGGVSASSTLSVEVGAAAEQSVEEVAVESCDAWQVPVEVHNEKSWSSLHGPAAPLQPDPSHQQQQQSNVGSWSAPAEAGFNGAQQQCARQQWQQALAHQHGPPWQHQEHSQTALPVVHQPLQQWPMQQQPSLQQPQQPNLQQEARSVQQQYALKVHQQLADLHQIQQHIAHQQGFGDAIADHLHVHMQQQQQLLPQEKQQMQLNITHPTQQIQQQQQQPQAQSVTAVQRQQQAYDVAVAEPGAHTGWVQPSATQHFQLQQHVDSAASGHLLPWGMSQVSTAQHAGLDNAAGAREMLERFDESLVDLLMEVERLEQQQQICKKQLQQQGWGQQDMRHEQLFLRKVSERSCPSKQPCLIGSKQATVAMPQQPLAGQHASGHPSKPAQHTTSWRQDQQPRIRSHMQLGSLHDQHQTYSQHVDGEDDVVSDILNHLD